MRASLKHAPKAWLVATAIRLSIGTMPKQSSLLFAEKAALFCYKAKRLLLLGRMFAPLI